jgi:putative ABC transport system permease protein
MRPLHLKLLRDLWKMRGQMVAIIAVLACGIAAYVAMLSVHASLRATGDSYFERYRLPDAFARVADAPEAVAARVAQIPGVQAVETRVVELVTLDVRGLAEPGVGQLVSIKTDRPPTFNALHLRRGRLPRPGRADEAVVSEAFADVHALTLGEELHVILGERRQALRIVGVGLSPEYIFNVPPGSAWPDDKRFAVLWMDARGLAIAANMEGRCNDVTVSLARGASLEHVLDGLDQILEPYGGRGAHGRDLQMSARFVSEELKQLQSMGSFVPMLFLAVAAFLLNVVVTRMVAGQREQIAALKALGYSNLSVGLHYGELMLFVVAIGTVAGAGLGAWMGDGLIGVYHAYFRFPELSFHLEPRLLLNAAALAVAAGMVGTFFAVRRAVALPPAEAMRPPAPATYTRGWLTRTGLPRLLGPSGRIVLRNVERRPFRTLLASVGLAMGVAIMITGTFSTDAMAYIMEVNYERVQQEDLTVTFATQVDPSAMHDLEAIPGVMFAEPVRMVPVRLHVGHRQYQTAVMGLTPDSKLRQLLDADLQRIPLPQSGLLLTSALAQRLHIEPGETLELEVLEGRTRTYQVAVAGTIEEMMGMSAYMELSALDELMGDGPRVTGARLLLDPDRRDVAYHHIKRLPRVAGATLRTAAFDMFNETTGKFQTATAVILGMFASIITIGVVYNSARVVLAERARELASLRVLGFTRSEVSGVLLGELFIQQALAVPIGCWLGHAFAVAAMRNVDTELYRFPIIIAPKTYMLAVGVMLAAGVVTGLIVRRKIDRLDLIGVLKTRD